LQYAFLFNRKERKGFRKVTQRYILKLCALCGSFFRYKNSKCVTPKFIEYMIGIIGIKCASSKLSGNTDIPVRIYLPCMQIFLQLF